MEKQDIYESLIGLLFPSDITEHFKIVHIESLPQVMVVHFEEKDEFHDKEGGHEYVPNGFYESSRINDFPIRDKKVTLDHREKSESPPEIEHLGNGRPHKINFHTLLFLKNCPHNTHENYCLQPTTFKGYGEPPAPSHHDFSELLIFRTAFYGLRLWQMRQQATSTTTTPSRNTNSQHQPKHLFTT